MGSRLRAACLRGNPFIEEVIFFHVKTRTVIIGDLIQNYSKEQLGLFGTVLARLENVLDGGVPRDIAFSFNFGKRAARRSLERLLSWDFDRRSRSYLRLSLIVGRMPMLSRGTLRFNPISPTTIH